MKKGKTQMATKKTTVKKTTVAVPAVPRRSPDEFDAWAARVASRARLSAGEPLFLVDVGRSMFSRYLSCFRDPVQRQVHTCHCCRRFLDRYGALATIGQDGSLTPVFWDVRAHFNEPYAGVEAALATGVFDGKVKGVFYSSEPTWGEAHTGDWNHFGFPALSKWSHPLRSAAQAMAEKKEEHGMLARGLADFSEEVIEKAVSLLRSEALYRSEKTLGPAEWLLALKGQLKNAPYDLRDNLVWKAVATAPAGFCHVRSTMIGTLLEDLAAGLSFDAVRTRFAEKMHPLQYMRPTAPPKAGNIDAAEKAIGALNSAGALRRRFARLDEIETSWKPCTRRSVESETGVFSHLRQPQPQSYVNRVSRVKITWEKFARTVLPHAEKIDAFLGRSPMSFAAYVTAADFSAPPIVKWDREEVRNPVTWYQYIGGSHPSRWGLASGWCDVLAVSPSPAFWNGRQTPGETEAALLVLDGCKDKEYVSSGGIFPEHLKSDFHPYRKTIEAHFMQASIEPAWGQYASGLLLQKGPNWDAVVAVYSGGVRTEYVLERWD